MTTEAAATAGATTIKSYNVQNILVSGNNNSFYNLSFINEGTRAEGLGGINITGARNYFEGCHIIGGMVTTATANERSLEIGASAQENVFVNCTIGTDTYDRGNNASCELYINGNTNTARNFFFGCRFLAEAEGGTAHGAIKSAGASAMGRDMIFQDCVFNCYRSNHGADQASLFIGTGLITSKLILAGNTTICGYALVDSSTTNLCVYASMPTPTATGGLAGVCAVHSA